jgi:antitoxin MazE
MRHDTFDRYIPEAIMQVARWGNSLAVRLPKALVERLGLKPGDEIEIVSAGPGRISVARDDRREAAVARMRDRALPLPEDYRFDRDEANER